MTGRAAPWATGIGQVVERHVRAAVEIAGQPRADWPLEDRMRRYRVPGMAVAVIADGDVAWAGGYGRAGPEGSPVRDDTRFQVASISKVVAACAALVLVDQGRIRLDDDVNRHLRRWRVPRNRFTTTEPVTLRRLLHHTAGVNVSSFDGYPPGADLPALVEILDGRPPSASPQIDVVTTPGTEYRYSGGGFCIIELLIEDVTGQSFAEAARELVIDPAAMRRSDFSAAPGDATGHDAAGAPIPGGGMVHPELAAAGLTSTVGDIAALIVALQRSVRHGQGLLSPAAIAELAAPSSPGGRGLGVDLAGAGAAARFRHGATNRGFAGRFEALVGRAEGIVALTNSDTGHSLVGEIVGTVGAAAGWPGVAPMIVPPPATSDAAICAGDYVAASGAAVTLAAKGDILVSAAPYGIRRAIPVDVRRFVDEDTAAEAIFDGDAVPATFALVVDGRVVDRFHRTAPTAERR